MGKWPQVGLVAGSLVLADQMAKLAASLWLAPRGRVQVLPGFFDLSFVLNPGVAFGLFSSQKSPARLAVLTAAALFALAVILLFVLKARPEQRLLLWGLALVSGGAVGNLADRLRLGAVVDFLDFYLGRYHWPAFNLADAGITVGTGLIIFHLWRSR